MADISDIEKALVSQCATALFGATSYLPMAAQACNTGEIIRIYRGWPDSSALDADLNSFVAHISVFAEQGMTRNTTRFQSDWKQTSNNVPTLTASVASNVVTFGGTGGAGQVAGVAIPGTLSTAAWAYRLGASDTPSTVAAALAALSGGTAAGAVLTLPGTAAIANVVADQTASQEWRRQTQGFRISCWCPSAALRDTLASTLDAALSQVVRFVAPDGSSCTMVYRTTYSDDKISKDGCWRRDLCFTVEYGTTPTQTQTPALWIGEVLKADAFAFVAGGGAYTNIGAAQPATSVLTDGSGNPLEDDAGNLIGARFT